MAQITGQQPFTALPNWIFHKQKAEPGWLSAYELAILLALQHFANGVSSGNCVFPSYKTLCVYAGISRNSAIKSIVLLQEKGLIRKEARHSENEQKTNVYHLVFWDGDQNQSTTRTPQSTTETGGSPGDALPQCASCTRTRTIEQEPSNNINPPVSPQQPKRSPARMDLPEWLEPYSEHLLQWLQKRQKRHKLTPELTSSTMRALEYARDAGALKLYCEYVSERNWQSLGFAGYKDTIEKLAKENGIATKTSNQGKPAMSPIVYTLN
jgi:DNA-binding transcriptional MocR family regulator